MGDLQPQILFFRRTLIGKKNIYDRLKFRGGSGAVRGRRGICPSCP